jgi:hypothetical protein
MHVLFCPLLCHAVPCCVPLTQQIRTLCLSPDGQLLLSIDENGRALLIARTRRVLLHHFSFKGPVAAAAFSPDGRFVAVAVGRLLQVSVCVGGGTCSLCLRVMVTGCLYVQRGVLWDIGCSFLQALLTQSPAMTSSQKGSSLCG